jgi:hypothetical protein
MFGNTGGGFFPPKDRVLIGAILLVVASLFIYGSWWSLNGPLETLARLETHRFRGDSAEYASALYHASHAKATQAARWSPTGYATLGTLGIIVSLGLILSARRWRSEP